MEMSLPSLTCMKLLTKGVRFIHAHCVGIKDCDILGRSIRCNDFRNSLRSTLSKQQAITKDNTSSISHTNYSHLTSAEKDARLKNLHDSLKVATRKLSTLEGKIKRIMETQAIHLEGNDNSDISSIVSHVTPLVEKIYPPNTPQRIFWDQQILFNSVKNPRQIKWHPFMIRFALNLKYLSTSAYKALRLSGVIHLPSERTLSDYTHWVTPHSGVQLEFIEELSRLLNELPSGPSQQHVQGIQSQPRPIHISQGLL